jgi:SAM-dependent methyltransferase
VGGGRAVNKDKKPIAHEAYEKLADAYAEMIETKPHNAYLERPATLSLLPDVKGKLVLDAGCGPGLYADLLVQHGAEVVAVDASPRMLEHARRRVGGKATIMLHDIREPFIFLGDDSVDLVLASLVMDYIEDWVPVFKEFRRVLKSDGVLVFSVGHPAINFVLKEGMEDYFSVHRMEMPWTGFGVEVVMPSYHRPIEAIVESLHETGFLMERLIEAKPTEDYRRADPEGYEKVSKRPSFLNIRAVPSP